MKRVKEVVLPEPEDHRYFITQVRTIAVPMNSDAADFVTKATGDYMITRGFMSLDDKMTEVRSYYFADKGIFEKVVEALSSWSLELADLQKV